MVFPNNFENKTGFDKIRETLKNNCLSSLGKELVDNITFSADYDLIIQQINQTSEFVKIVQEEDEFPIDAYFDIRESLSKIKVEGTFLDANEVFQLRRSLDTIDHIVRFFKQKEEKDYYYLIELSKDVFTFPDIIRLIDRIVDKFGYIKDNASPELLEIRRSITSAQSSISKTLAHILRQAQEDGYIDKDTNPSVRDGRLVIPVSPAFKRKIRGIVHDESATGKTVYIEPESVVEINNKIRELISEEKREIIRILTAFTNEIRPRVPELLDSYQYLAEIDFIRSKAIFAIDTNSTLPKIQNDTVIDWGNAIHPILYLAHKKLGKTVVPLSISLDKEKRILLISGPNAGGKSVCLKTVGLLQYMLQCGLLVPVYSSSIMGIFNDIFIDIGDEQSIENDLSTYSSHLTNMKQFVKNCNEKSIILIDEFGSGTEPRIGGAIAESLLDHFNQKKAFGVITTHYTNLKNFAEDTDGIINGAMQYDRHLMQPLFQLEIGHPGSSFAIEIARKIGLPENVIQEASDKVGHDFVNMDKYLQDIVRDKRYWEGKRQNIRQKEKHLEELTEKYEEQLKKLAAERKEMILEAKSESQKLLSQSNAIIENTIRKIKEAQADKEKTHEARTELDNFKKDFFSDKNEGNRIDRKIAQLNEHKNKKAVSNPVVQSKAKEEKLTIGDYVRIKGQTSHGSILEIKGNTAIIALGQIKSSVKIDQLEKISKTQIKKNSNVKSTFISESTTEEIRTRQLNFKREIDLRGMRGDEALQAVTYFIDDAILVNVNQVRILHGTGTGALRELIRSYLKTIPEVTSFNDEQIQFGGVGITVVHFD